MKQGDFSNLAKNYIHRPAYSELILRAILKYMDYDKKANFKVADVGAGTGKLTKMLLEMELDVVAVEPNDAMREEGRKYTQEHTVKWINGSGESTTLENESVDWVIMGSSFHWTNPKISLPEFHRILKPDGFFSAMWNPRNIESSELHTKIENNIYEIAPNIKRVSSGSKKHTQKWEDVLVSSGHFRDVIFMEVDHLEMMTKDRYMGAWNSVNDIRSQAGEDKWKLILESIESEIKDLDIIEVPYKIRAWTAQKVG